MRGLECAPVWAPPEVLAELALVLSSDAYLSSSKRTSLAFGSRATPC
jgi:hypothetical protein